jgi:hypothetical protein
MNIACLVVLNNLYWNNSYRKKSGSMQHGFSLHCNYQESNPNIKQRLSVLIINWAHQRKIWQFSMPVFINIRDLSPIHCNHTDSGGHTTPSPIHARCTAPQVKWPGSEDGQTLVSSACRQLHLYPQHVLMQICLNKHADNFTFTLMIRYDIFVNCNWVVTRWQKYSTHLHTNNT